MEPRPFTRAAACLTLLCFATACGGRIAKPTPVAYFQDPMKSCEMLEQEMATLQHDIIVLELRTDKDAKNQGLMLASLILLFPVLFMDTSNADKIEYEALRQRYNHLLTIAIKKGCPTDRRLLSVDPAYVEDEAPKQRKR